jgi:hypothetical protein
MKTSAYLLLAGIIVTAGAATKLQAQTWEQALNIAYQAQVQISDGTVKRTSISSKQIIALLSSINNIVTNNSDTVLSNSVDTPEPLPVNPFPASVVVNSNYVVLVGGQTFTNNVDFTHTVVFTRTSTSPVTYTFTNAVTVGTNGTGFFVNDFPVPFVTATLQSTNGPAYELTGTTITTNNTPPFSSFSKLLVIHDLNSGTDRFVVRDGRGSAAVDTDVSPFFGLNTFSTVTQSRAGGNSFTGYSHIDFSFNNTKGDNFDSQGVSTQTSTDLKVRGNDVGVVRRNLNGTTGGDGTIANVPGVAGPIVLSGRFVVGGGRFVAGP